MMQKKNKVGFWKWREETENKQACWFFEEKSWTWTNEPKTKQWKSVSWFWEENKTNAPKKEKGGLGKVGPHLTPSKFQNKHH